MRPRPMMPHGAAEDLVSDGLFPTRDPLAGGDVDGVLDDLLGDAEEEAEGVLGDGGVIHPGVLSTGSRFSVA